MGDTVGESTARMNVSDLRKMLGLPDLTGDPDTDSLVSSTTDIRSGANSDAESTSNKPAGNSSSSRHYRVRRQSMEQLDLIKVFFSLVDFWFMFSF